MGHVDHHRDVEGRPGPSPSRMISFDSVERCVGAENQTHDADRLRPAGARAGRQRPGPPMATTTVGRASVAPELESTGAGRARWRHRRAEADSVPPASPRGELVGDRLMPAAGTAESTPGQAAEDDVELAPAGGRARGRVGCRRPGVGRSARSSLPQKLSASRSPSAVETSGPAQQLGAGRSLSSRHRSRPRRALSSGEPTSATPVWNNIRGLPEGVDERVGSRPLVTDQRTGIEGLQVERDEVEMAGEFGIVGEEDLEAAIEREAVDDVAADPATHSVRRPRSA